MRIREHVSLAPYTTFRIGGPARYFLEARSEADIREALAFARDTNIRVFVLGGGSNILVSDEGFDGLVLKVELAGITFQVEAEKAYVTVGAGVLWDDLVARTTHEGYAGLESMSGVPGTVGGGVVANIGCYGAQLSDAFVAARVLDLREPKFGVKELSKDVCGFSYHDSVFSHAPEYLVLDATFRVQRASAARPAYTDNRFDLAALAAKNGRAPMPADVRAAVLAIRAEKGTLQSSYQSAGSFFHMPFVSEGDYERVRQRASALDAEKEQRLRPWAWGQADGSYKLAPGFLLEYTEFKKGYARGEAAVSPKHTLTLINRGSASARAIAALARDMQRAVKDIFGIELEREVEYVGDVEKLF